jgi:hypothetical protein
MDFEKAKEKYMEESVEYDSTEDTNNHIQRVNELLAVFGGELTERGKLHDQSKLQDPEKAIFDKVTPALKELTYGSDEYKQQLEEMKEALDNHYANNRHHPEFHENGIKGMNLVDLVEMFVDWRAATERHADGNIRESIEKNQERFGYSDDIKEILLNSVEMFENKKEEDNE